MGIWGISVRGLLGPPSTRSMTLVAPRLRSRAIDEFVKAALSTGCGLVLVEEGKRFLIELLEEVVPFDGFQGLVTWRKIEAQQAGIAIRLGGLDCRRNSPAFLRPAPDLVVIGRDFAFGHGWLLAFGRAVRSTTPKST